jgi:aspartyl-tRNA(Asn)/glutamyl-tRNA(Gln) amidotransferase subunit A
MNMICETVKSLRGKLDRREISTLELCSEYIEVAEAMNPAIRALVDINGETALETAQTAQQSIDKGEANALTGIPVVISDNIMTKGIITTCASKMLKEFVPPYDAKVTERLNEVSCPMLGKGRLDEFSMRNSTVQGRAVSSGFAPFSIASDTGGGLRQSAALGGLTGLRPTYGRVSRYGLAAFASSIDQIGPIAQTAEDCAIVFNAVSVKDPKDATCFGNPDNEDFTGKIGSGVKGLKIAVLRGISGKYISDEARTALLDAAEEFKNQGAELIEIKPDMYNYSLAAYYIISSAEAASNLARCDGVNYGLKGEGATYLEQIIDARTKGFGDEVKSRIMFGNYVLSNDNYTEFYQKSLALRQKIKAEYDEIFKTADIIITPTLADNVENLTDIDLNIRAFYEDLYTVPPSLAGLPSISTTCGYKSTGLPIGMQLTGRKCDEKTVIQAADCFERIFNPDLFGG